ncbi:hypothetical protein HMSSN036_66960 [Paenibacillus macerans]|nr:hypothetical protein HMSSN036_66960 [Paenibacillus macerans]
MFYSNMSSKDKTSPINTPDIHGFVMFGEKTLFLEHLPMFNMENHEYQLILEISISSDAMQVYNNYRTAHPHVPLVLANSQNNLFTLPDLVSGRRISFVGEILIWETEDPQTNPRLISDVGVNIERSIHYRHFPYK